MTKSKSVKRGATSASSTEERDRSCQQTYGIWLHKFMVTRLPRFIAAVGFRKIVATVGISQLRLDKFGKSPSDSMQSCYGARGFGCRSLSRMTIQSLDGNQEKRNSRKDAKRREGGDDVPKGQIGTVCVGRKMAATLKSAEGDGGRGGNIERCPNHPRAEAIGPTAGRVQLGIHDQSAHIILVREESLANREVTRKPRPRPDTIQCIGIRLTQGMSRVKRQAPVGQRRSGKIAMGIVLRVACILCTREQRGSIVAGRNDSGYYGRKDGRVLILGKATHPERSACPMKCGYTVSKRTYNWRDIPRVRIAAYRRVALQRPIQFYRELNRPRYFMGNCGKHDHVYHYVMIASFDGVPG
ncbi:hypothetical protein GLOTRDRAFT_97086 [Gloeophyllum trabeum ATCC 11539]|uniref:Uncharacterized protein n=1 Tax=Gloeophyllum trabeum (strain ATCC 11539 / FP-39264 / Madison 617) TaxID=670483 RepID=S7PSJ6_GLOTA|nr:uncharacterized protein GLOTRDRAFT_97086 [Gloeophyllum trabeum ATCC 11539]EPQ50362.1 hypothetical protein GLOTRDRAFT_97086 [Gloeophyllum trabeum ATCC 11539]